MAETSTAPSSSPVKPLALQQIAEPSPSQQNVSLLQQKLIHQQQMQIAQLQQHTLQRPALHNSTCQLQNGCNGGNPSLSIGNNLNLQRNIENPVSKIMRLQQLCQHRLKMNSGDLNSTQNNNINNIINHKQTPHLLPWQTQGQNALISQNGLTNVMHNTTSPHPRFMQMPLIDSPHPSLHRLQQQPKLQQPSPRMVGHGGQKSVCFTPGTSSTHGTESSNQFVRKRMIHDVVSQLDLNGNLDPEVEGLVFKIAGNFIDLVTTLAKHPRCSTLDSKDVLLHPAGGSKLENSKSVSQQPHCGPEATEMGKRCNEVMGGIQRRMNAQDASINELKARYQELCMALVICVGVMLFMLWDRLVQGW